LGEERERNSGGKETTTERQEREKKSLAGERKELDGNALVPVLEKRIHRKNYETEERKP